MGSGAAEVWNWDGVMTLLSRLPPWLYSRVSGCHVRRRHASSAALDMDSRRDHPAEDTVGEERRLLLLEDAKTPLLDELMGPGPKRGRPRPGAGATWNGLPLDGTLSRRPGVRLPAAYMLWDREWEDVGDATPDPHLGLPWLVENVADVGVL